jgi:benzoate/toluate 1,2-dioxygenase reductase subunit
VNRLEFFIRSVPGGAFSQWLAGAKVGDAVELSAPHGTFFLRDEDRPRLFVAGGTGVAPFLSMLRSMARPTNGCAAHHLCDRRAHARPPVCPGRTQELGAQLAGMDLQIAVEQDAGAGCHAGYPTDLIHQLGLDPDHPRVPVRPAAHGGSRPPRRRGRRPAARRRAVRTLHLTPDPFKRKA